MTQALSFPDLNDQTYHWSIEQYHQMIATGILQENDRVELLAGKIINMSPIGSMHAACITKLNVFFYSKFIHQYTSIRKPNHSN